MDDPSPDLIKDANIHHQLNESHLSYRELFRRLDLNHDGRIEVEQLIELVEKVGVQSSTNTRWAIARVSFSSNKIFNRFSSRYRGLLIKLVDYPMHLLFHLNNLRIMF
jgi:hypothetical protein